MQNNNFNNGATNNNSNNNGGFIMSTGTINTVDLFAEVVKAGLEEAHPECSVVVHKVTKNNSLVLTGISIRSREVNLAPTIYVKNSMSCHSSTLTHCHKLIHLSVTVFGGFTPDFSLCSSDHFMVSNKTHHMFINQSFLLLIRIHQCLLTDSVYHSRDTG